MSETKKRWRNACLKGFFTLLLLGIITFKVDLSTAIHILSHAHLGLFGLAVFLFILAAFGRAYRFYLIYRTACPVRFKQVLPPYLLAVGYGSFFTPSEDIYKFLGFHKAGDPSWRAACVFLDRFTGAFGLFCSAFIGLAIAFGYMQSRLTGLSELIGIMVLLLLLGFMVGGFMLKYAARLSWGPKLSFWVERFYWIGRYSKQFLVQHPVTGLMILLMAVGLQLVINTPAYYLAWRAVGGDDLFLSAFFVVVPIVAALNVLPVSFLGIGVRDLSMLYMLGALGAQQETIIAASCLILLVRVISAVAVLLVGQISEC